MNKLILSGLTVSFLYNSTSLEASNMTLEGLEEFCVKSSPCYYNNGLWHHYEPESSTDPWGPSGVALGAVGLVAAIAVPLTDRLIDWIISKCSSNNSRWTKIDTIETTLNSMKATNQDHHNQLTTLAADLSAIDEKTEDTKREVANGFEEIKDLLKGLKG